MGIEENIRVTGADKAAQDIDRVADSTKRAGDKTVEAGRGAEAGSRDFDGLSDSAQGAGRSFSDFAQKMSSGFLGFEAMLNVATKFREQLEQIVQLQRELADQSTGALEAAFPLADQWDVASQEGQEQALRTATELRKAAVMSSLNAAVSLGIGADISLPGGLNPLKDQEAYSRNLPIAAAVGAAIPLGTEATYTGIFELLATAGITDPEQIKDEMARVLSIQKASQSASLGSFVAGMASPGIKAFLGQGGSFTDAAIMLLQARAAATNDAQATTIADVMLRVSRGSTGTQEFLGRRSEELGFGRFETLTDTQRLQLLERIFVEASQGGPEAMTALQREGFEPGQFPLIVSAFSASAREAAAKARGTAGQTSGADIDRKIKDFRESQIGIERLQQADIEYAEAVAGMQVYDIAKLRELAEHRNKLRLARPGMRGGEVFEAVLTSPEALIEREAMGILLERIAGLEAQGIDTTGATAA